MLNGRHIGLGALSLLVFLAMAGGVEAQSKKELATRLDRVERQLRAVQRRVFMSGEVVDDEEAASASSRQERAMLANMSAQLGSIERQLRELTGRLEQAEFMQNQQAEQLDLLRREMELRFSELSGAGAVPQSGAVPADAQPAIVAPDTAAAQNAVSPVLLPEGDAATRYEYAFSFVRSGDLARGEEAMSLFLAAHGDHALAPGAIFWLGRIHLRQKQYGQAARRFLELVDGYPKHDKYADSLVDLAETLIQLDSKKDACDALSEFSNVKEGVSGRLKSRAERLGRDAGCPA